MIHVAADKELLSRAPGQHVCCATWSPRFLSEPYAKPGSGVKNWDGRG